MEVGFGGATVAQAIDCSVCGMNFSSKNKMMKHLRAEHSDVVDLPAKEEKKGKPPRKPRACRQELNFGCEVCGKKFIREKDVQQHMNDNHNAESGGKGPRKHCKRCDRPSSVCLCDSYPEVY